MEVYISLMILILTAAKKYHDNFDEILQVKAERRKYLKEKWYLGQYEQLSLKHFGKLFLISKFL